ncbi:hypothetical protein BJX63DRAFT_361253 [Aspergillus granulosus]|uniref:Uncharacterized protein n=1 Tax=Aspergillus granulosus TaxID=176169 RepID=A0ABR4HXE7_9EURO
MTCLGTMMTEIGLAQQRLFDDDHQAQCDNQPVEFHESGLGPIHVERVNQRYMAQEEALPANHVPITPAHDSIPRVGLHGTTHSDDWSQSAPSYNIFDSSNQTLSSQLNRTDFLRDSRVTTQTELLQNFELRRWTSMQDVTSSPHDTEPSSSVIAKAARAKSDNIVPNAIQRSPSVDELALPATTEIPKVEKRGRKKKQILPVNDEDVDFPHAASRETPPPKPEKRKPGRPPKTAKVDTAASAERSDAPSHPPESSVIAETAVEYKIIPPQIIPPELNVPERDMQPSPKLKKEPGKKKVKRSMTTSVTLTKTFEPDVEDDVIWIDERPIVPADPEDRPNLHQAESVPDPATAPKKRGRKRKKTAEQLKQEAEAQAKAEAASPLGEINNPEELNETSHNPGISVVLKSSTRNQSPDITNPDFCPEEDTFQEPQASEPELPQPTSPSKELHDELIRPPETPQKPTDPRTPSTKGPGKHSPISSTCKVPYRVGLSKRARIAPLLKIIKR